MSQNLSNLFLAALCRMRLLLGLTRNTNNQKIYHIYGTVGTVIFATHVIFRLISVRLSVALLSIKFAVELNESHSTLASMQGL